MQQRLFLTALSLFLVFTFFNTVHAQPPVWTLNLIDSSKRSEKFVERKLGSEKMAEKKFNLYRRVVQNNFTHYNYVFNANNKINAVLERAKAAQKDDYTKLIPYYPYNLENTASQKTELDSVIYKATAGILLHDLRNDWIDNMYLLMGKAYFLKKDFDTAAATFQFINYNLFPRKKNEDGDRIVGTTEDASSSRISIANKEKQNILQKFTAQPPSRNDALIWLARTLTEQDELGEAAGLIHTLQNDPNLPKRLVDDLNDVNGYWFFKQAIYDSAAVYLEMGLSTAVTKQDKARSEFLLAQLYEFTNHFDKATKYYNIASAHTTNPLLDIYAQLNNAKMRKGNNLKELDKGIDNLVKLTKKDKFESYRDILYLSAGDLALQKPDTNQAVSFYNKSLSYNETNIIYKNKAFLQLADIAYSRKEYKDAFRFYDSLQSGDTSLKETLDKIQNRRNALSKIVEKIIIIEREDSLQMVAAMEPAARTAFVKKISKKLRKAQGLKEEDNNASVTGTDLISFDKDKDKPADLFPTSSKSGEWYFYNASVRSKGFSDFKKKWGTRTNTDNWRRKSAAADATPRNLDNVGIGNMNPDDDTPIPVADDKNNKKAGAGDKKDAFKNLKGKDEIAQPEDLSFEGLMSNLPLTPEKLSASNNLLAVNLFELGKLFQQELEDYQQAINTYDQSLKRFPDSVYGGEIYLNLAYCYSKLGNTAKADQYKKIVTQQYGQTNAAKMLTDINAPKKGEKNAEGTKRYEAIYNLFIEGKFEDALSEKNKADSLYGKNYWTPQLLYIEAVYHVKQKNDSAAIKVLNNIISLYPKSPLKPKAVRMIDVLGRRKEIEKYLTDLQVTRMKEDSTIQTNDRVAMIRNDSNLIKSPKRFDSSKAIITGTDSAMAKKDSLMKAAPPLAVGPYAFNATAQHNVIMLMDKVDGTYVNESKNAFARYLSDYFRDVQITITKDAIDKDYALLVFSSFANADEALQFLNKIKKAAPDEISWLPANKYSFLLIDNDNLQRLKATKDIAGYKKLLNGLYPGIVK